MTPNPDLLRIEFLGITAAPRRGGDAARGPRALLRRLSDRYGLTRLEYHSDAGATFSGPDGAECVLRPAQIASCGVTGLGYREGVERVVGLLSARPSSATASASSGSRTSPWWPCGTWRTSESARELLVGNVLQVDEDRLDLLGGERRLAGAAHLAPRAASRPWRCAIEPMHSEPSKVYIRLVQSQSEPMRRGLAARGGRRRARLPAGPPDVVHDGARPPLTD